MTRPGYVPRPSLPCADSVALMAATPVQIRRLSYSATTLSGIGRMLWDNVRPRLAAKRLMLYPWFFEAHAPEVQAEIKMWTFAASRYQEIG